MPKCKDCAHLCGRTSSVGIECMQPDNQKKWNEKQALLNARGIARKVSARYKQPSAKACKKFEPHLEGPKVYIAGPISGVRGYEHNFERAAKLLRANRYEPVSPIAPGLVEGYEYRDYINRGLRMLEVCDLICMLPGSQNSPGARLEMHYAALCGLPMVQVSEDYQRILGVDMVANCEG